MNAAPLALTSRVRRRPPRARPTRRRPWTAISSRRRRTGIGRRTVDLIRVRQDHLFATAQRVLRDIDRAEDALQDALVIAWRDLRGLRDPDRFDAWLQRLLINVCINHATRERRRTANLRVLPVDGPAGPDDLLSVADRDLLERGFRRLPPEQRAILVLNHYLGYAPSEIAETLGIPAGTARSRLHHAHRAMRAALEADARTQAKEGRPA
jgi:RNA polymerase sigma-70 factor (ECF subfamily)